MHLGVCSQVFIRACSQGLSSLHSSTLPACLAAPIRVSSHDSLMHTPEHAPRYTLQRQDTPNFSWLYAPIDAAGCWIQRLAELQAPATRWREVGGGCQEAKILTSVNIIVWFLFLVAPPPRDLTIPHSHGGDNCSLKFSRKGRQLDLGESRSLTQTMQWNLLLASHRLGVAVGAFSACGDDGNGDNGDDGDDNGIGDGDHSTRST